MTEESRVSRTPNLPPNLLNGEDGEVYVLVSEFTDEQMREAAKTAIDEWSLATDDVPEAAAVKLANTGIKFRFRQHTAANDEDCNCMGEGGPGYWCEFGKGEVEGLYAHFEFGVAEDILMEAYR